LRLKNVFVFWLIGLLMACSNFSLTFLDGDKKNINEFEGQWLLINYWAAWCKPCLKEIPELNVFNSRSDIEVLAFNYDQLDEITLKEQIIKFDIQYLSLAIDPASLFKQPKPNGLPATMVVSPKGEFVEWLYGAQTNDSLLEALNKHQ
jgi:thiol-disulfide isomerase/thioredoxin